ncbi:MAG: low molecular weight phosphatase family protein [Desulfobacteraceae bacterium]|nr:low molecular weight phosphatase family protein [Desulfobacteraceae bacterium]
MNILMVCTGNICRSPMAEGLLVQLLPETLKDRVTVESAGTHALHGAMDEDFAIKTAAAYNADITGHRARLLGINMLRNADMIITMEKGHLKIIKIHLIRQEKIIFKMIAIAVAMLITVSDP